MIHLPIDLPYLRFNSVDGFVDVILDEQFGCRVVVNFLKTWSWDHSGG